VIVVSNTSPMTNLAAIGQVALLRQLYGGVYIPEAVYRELRAGESRGDHPPFLEAADWIQVRAVPLETLQSLAPYRLDRGGSRSDCFGGTAAGGLAPDGRADRSALCA
jgi:predicted nucleic acid-binding protein